MAGELKDREHRESASALRDYGVTGESEGEECRVSSVEGRGARGEGRGAGRNEG